MRSDELGLRLPPLPNRPYFVTVEKTRPIDLKLAARFAGMSVEEFLELNPAHNRPVIAASRNNGIKIPADREQSFLAAVAQHGEENRSFTTWQPYTLKAGDTIEGLAARSSITPAELRRANGLKPGSRILAGSRLLLPQTGSVDDRQVETFVAPRVIEQIDVPALYHTKRNASETLAAIGKRYGVLPATLTKLNGLQGEPPVGHRLLVRPAATQTIMITEEGRRTVVAAPRPETPPRAIPVVARPPAPAGPPRPSGGAPSAAPAKTQNNAPAKPQQKPAGGSAEKPKTTGSSEPGRVTRTSTPPASSGATGSGGTVQRAAPPASSKPKPDAKPAVTGATTGLPRRMT